MRKISKYGWKKDHPDYRDLKISPITNDQAVVLPITVDLRKNCPPVMDQGSLGSCTAHGITGAIRYNTIKNGGKDIPLSRLQLYYDERALEGTIKSDAGAEIRDGIKTASLKGIAPEILWPYDITKFKKKPTSKVYTAAKTSGDQKLTYSRVNITINDMKAVLASGSVIIVGFTCYESMESDLVAKTGILPMPKHNEKVIGGHCVYIVGYGIKPGTFTARNSWGTGWGDSGDFHLPENFIGNVEYGSDYWVIH